MSGSVDVKMWSCPKLRQGDYVGTGITREAEVIDVKVVGDAMDQLMAKLAVGQFVKLMAYDMYLNTRGRRVFKLGRKSRVFVTSTFSVDSEKEAAYYNAEEVSIGEAVMMSDESRRVSVRGVVVDVSPVKAGPQWTRCDVDVKDGATDCKIRCKLWGRFAETAVKKNDAIKLTNVEKRKYKGYQSLDTTEESEVSILTVQEVESRDVVVTAFSCDKSQVELVTEDNKVWKMELGKLEESVGHAEDLQEKLPLACRVEWEGTSPSDIVKLDIIGCEASADAKE